LEDHLESRARVKAGSDFAGERLPREGNRLGVRSIAAEKLGSVGGVAQRRRARTRKGYPSPEVGVVNVARQEGLAFRVPVRHDVHLGFLATRSEDPVDVGEDGKTASA